MCGWLHRLPALRSRIQKRDTALASAITAILVLPVFRWFLALTKAVGAGSPVLGSTSSARGRSQAGATGGALVRLRYAFSGTIAMLSDGILQLHGLRMVPRFFVLLLAVVALPIPAWTIDRAGDSLPEPAHVLVAIFENHSFDQIKFKQSAFHQLSGVEGRPVCAILCCVAPQSTKLFALFSGSTQGVRDNEDHTFDAPCLASELVAAGKSFAGYVEAGSPRKHNPWESFTTARATERDFDEFPTDFRLLPTVSFVIPRLHHDMHDGSVSRGDAWLRDHLGAYAEWAKSHGSLFIITFDEDDDTAGNHIPTIIYGAHVRRTTTC